MMLNLGGIMAQSRRSMDSLGWKQRRERVLMLRRYMRDIRRELKPARQRVEALEKAHQMLFEVANELQESTVERFEAPRSPANER